MMMAEYRYLRGCQCDRCAPRTAREDQGAVDKRSPLMGTVHLLMREGLSQDEAVHVAYERGLVS